MKDSAGSSGWYLERKGVTLRHTSKEKVMLCQNERVLLPPQYYHRRTCPKFRKLFGANSINILHHVWPDDKGPFCHWEVLNPEVTTKRQSEDFGLCVITEILPSCWHVVENCMQRS